MRILVVSDTHGDYFSLKEVVQTHSSAEIIVHCGDGDEQVDFLKNTYKNKMIIAVKGNCDFGSTLPATEFFTVQGKKIMVTHGHLYNAKATFYNLLCAAKENNADIVLFGHTHTPISLCTDDVYFLNPGSCHGYRASYGFVDITDKGDIVTNTAVLK